SVVRVMEEPDQGARRGRGRPPHRTCVYLFVLAVMLAGTASAQQFGLPAMVKGVGIDQNLNAQVPLELLFKDDTGQTVRLGQYFRKKPVVLALVYYECPMLCDMVMNGLTHTMEQISLDLGRDYEVVSVSFNPHETWQLAAAKKANYVEKYQRKGAAEGWHFLTGTEDNIKKLADTAGFHYKYDPVTKQFAHAAGIMVLTPEGKIARYFYGIEYKPRDFRLGLVEASQKKIGSPVDAFMLFCYHYDPMTGKYGVVISNVIRVLGSATVIALGTLLFVLIRHDRQTSAAGRPV
ncbi:MAG TPA: SCO family protein, partial [Nitrospiraceae bacterium]|nr:SCO family protein [Nitrospiraceae bacterium]